VEIPHPILGRTTLTTEALLEEVLTTEAAQAEDATTMIDHMAEMAIVTAMTRGVAEATAMVEVLVEEEAVGQLPMVREITNVGIEAGRASTILVHSAVVIEGTAVGTGGMEATTGGMMGVPPVPTTGRYHYPGMTGLNKSYSLVAMDPRVSTSIDMRISRSRLPDPMYQMGLKISPR